MQLDINTGANFQLMTQSVNRSVDQILPGGLLRDLIVAVNGERNAWASRFYEAQFVMERNALEDAPKFMIAIGALAEDVQTKIYFSESWDANFGHAAY